MNFLSFLKEGFKQNELVQTVLKPKLTMQSVESSQQQLEQSLTFFNRIVQQVSIINLNHHVTSVSSETYFDPPEQVKLYSYIPLATSSILNEIDPVYSIQSISPKLLRYQLELVQGDKQDIKQHLQTLQEYDVCIQEEINNNLQNNHQFLYESFIQIQQTYAQLLSLSQSISTYRTTIKSHLFRILQMYKRLESKSFKLRQIKGKMEFFIDFKTRIGVIYSNQGNVYEKLLAISNNLSNLNNNPRMFEKILCLKGVKQKCIVGISQCELQLTKRVKHSIFQKYIPESILDIVISSYLFQYLFKKQTSKTIISSINQHLKVIIEFINNPSGCANIKDYLEILYKYLNNINKFKQYLKSTKTNVLAQIINVEVDNISKHLREFKQRINKVLETFFANGYQRLGEVCEQIIKVAKEDDKRVIKKFIEMVDADHLSDGFKDFKKKIKEALKKH